MTEFTVSVDKISLESFVRERCFMLTRSRFIGHVKNKNIRVNGVHPKLPCVQKNGDSVFLYFEVNEPKIDVVYNDGDLLVINKQQGLPSNGDDYHTAEKSVKSLFPTAMLCHRLDVNTCGLLMFALNKKCYEFILDAQKKGAYDKIYRTVVSGRPEPSATLKHYIKKDALRSHVEVSDKARQGYRDCALSYKTLKACGDLSLLEVVLHTGRTHQIRAQLAFCKLPLLGDDRYGNRQINSKYHVQKQALQAFSLDFSKTVGDFAFCGTKIVCEEYDFFERLNR